MSLFNYMGKDQALILKKRAQDLAKLSEHHETAHFLELLAFNLSKESYAIELSFIREVVDYKECTYLPGGPSFLHGILSIRSRLLSVIDLKVFLGIPSDHEGRKKIIVLKDQTREFGLLCDGGIEIKQIASHQIQTSLPALLVKQEEYLKGITQEGLAILDGQKILEGVLKIN